MGKTEPAKSVLLISCEYAPFPGGIGTYATQMALAMKEAGIVVEVICPRYTDDTASDAPKVHRLLGHHKIPAWSIPAIVRIIRASGCDVVLAADIRTIMLIHATRWLHGKRHVAMVHGSEAAKFSKSSPLFGFVRRAYHSALRVAYNSEATRAIFTDAFGEPQADVVCYLGIHPMWFEPPTPGSTCSIELTHGVSIVCSIGRIERRKGQLLAVRALARMKARHGVERIRYVIVGHPEDPTYVEEIKAEAAALDVDILLTGRLSLDDIKHIYRRAACNLLLAQPLPGKTEGFGLVLGEAAAQGCPSVATSEGGIAEVLGETGALCDSSDLDGMAESIWKFVAILGDRKQIAEDAIGQARKFTWRTCMEATFTG